MNAIQRIALPVLALLVLAGCATPQNQSLKPSVATAMQPVEVNVGIRQPELSGNFKRSTAGASAAAGCGAIPGIGILLAAACGGAMGAVDASANAAAAKKADEVIRPLKDEIVDLNFDQMMNEALNQSLKGVPGINFAGVAVTKSVTDKDYEQVFKTSTAGGVMFVNVEYRISIDLSALEIFARARVYPRSGPARTAAGLPADINAPSQDQLLSNNNTAYRSALSYRAALPNVTGNPEEKIAAWKANSGHLLRAAIRDGVAQVSRLLAEDLQRGPDAPAVSLSKVTLENNVQVDLVAENNGGKLMRASNGTLIFRTTLTDGPVATQAEAAKPVVR